MVVLLGNTGQALRALIRLTSAYFHEQPMSIKSVVVLLVTALLSACGEPSTITASPVSDPSVPSIPRFLVAECDTVGTTIAPCNDTGGPYEWPLGIGESGDDLYQAVGDPSPNSPGLWLGPSVEPASCFADRSFSVVADADHDWLADHCELELAKAFAPTLRVGFDDGCPGGEPYWAAKYFLSGQRIRIAYLPAYYRDCGFDGHLGDSEAIMVEVGYNGSTQHWEFKAMFLTAHHGAGFGIQRSTWVTTDAEFAHRSLTHPIVWVSRAKHANYPSYSVCNDHSTDSCQAYWVFPLRIPVISGRNVGSRFTDLTGCVSSSILPLPFFGGTECFWGDKRFRGWVDFEYLLQISPLLNVAGATPYGDFLMSEYFEKNVSSSGASWGPGPESAPSLQLVTPLLSGEVQDGHPRLIWPPDANATSYRLYRKWFRYPTEQGSSGFDDVGEFATGLQETTMNVDAYTAGTVPNFSTEGYVAYYVVGQNGAQSSAPSAVRYFRLTAP